MTSVAWEEIGRHIADLYNLQCLESCPQSEFISLGQQFLSDFGYTEKEIPFALNQVSGKTVDIALLEWMMEQEGVFSDRFIATNPLLVRDFLPDYEVSIQMIRNIDRAKVETNGRIHVPGTPYYLSNDISEFSAYADSFFRISGVRKMQLDSEKGMDDIRKRLETLTQDHAILLEAGYLNFYQEEADKERDLPVKLAEHYKQHLSAADINSVVGCSTAGVTMCMFPSLMTERMKPLLKEIEERGEGERDGY